MILSALMEYSVDQFTGRELQMDRAFRYQYNRISYAIVDVEQDIARLDYEHPLAAWEVELLMEYQNVRLAREVKTVLGELDGSTAAAVSLITGLSVDELHELGGFAAV